MGLMQKIFRAQSAASEAKYMANNPGAAGQRVKYSLLSRIFSRLSGGR